MALAALGLVAGTAAYGALRLVREERRLAWFAALGLSATALFTLLAAVPMLEGGAPAPWLARPGAIAAAVGTLGVAVLGFERAFVAMSAKHKNAASALWYGLFSLIAAGAAVRLLL